MLQVYVVFYSAANFFLPLVVLVHTYFSICLTLWRFF
jgi:hypothetical protein